MGLPTRTGEEEAAETGEQVPDGEGVAVRGNIVCCPSDNLRPGEPNGAGRCSGPDSTRKQSGLWLGGGTCAMTPRATRPRSLASSSHAQPPYKSKCSAPNAPRMSGDAATPVRGDLGSVSPEGRWRSDCHQREGTSENGSGGGSFLGLDLLGGNEGAGAGAGAGMGTSASAPPALAASGATTTGGASTTTLNLKPQVAIMRETFSVRLTASW